METSFYIIIIVLVLFKLMIWACVFYARYRRRKFITCHTRGFIIVQGPVENIMDTDVIIHNEHLPSHLYGVDNPAAFSPTAFSAVPPTYEEVQHTMDAKPPSYEQIIHSNNGFNRN